MRNIAVGLKNFWGSILPGGWAKRSFIFLFAIVLFVLPVIGGETRYVSVLLNVGFGAMVALGLGLLFGYAGQFSLGHAAFVGVGAYVSGITTTRFGLPPALGTLAAVGGGLLLGLAISPILRLKRFYFAVSTIAVGVVMATLFKGLRDWTGGALGLRDIPNYSVGGLVFDTPIKYYYLVWGLVLVMMWVSRNLINSRVGRNLQALRHDEAASQMLGINTGKLKIQVFLLSTVFASISGSIYAHYFRVASPEMFQTPKSLQFLIMALIGGAHSVWGAPLGAAFLFFIPDFFQSFVNFQLLFYGIALILVMAYAPRGIMGAIEDLTMWVRAYLPKRGPGPAAEPQSTNGSVPAQEVLDTVVALQPRSEASSKFPLLEVQGIAKSFGGVRAIENLSFSVYPGQIKTLVGPNGAGKTTAFNIISGLLRPDSGTVKYKGKAINGLPPYEIAGMGLARTFQVVRPFPTLPVLVNVMLGCECNFSQGMLDAAMHTRRATTEESTAEQRAQCCLLLVGLGGKSNHKASALTLGQAKLLEIARALAVKPELLLLDEPSGGLSGAESEELAKLLFTLRDRGIGILLVEHNMKLVTKVSDEVVFLDFGRKVAEGTPTEIQSNPQVISAYLGTG